VPLLVVHSRFSRDSRILRETAQQQGWETLRLDGWQLPDWLDTEIRDVAIFATMPDATDIAERFSRTLVGCGPDWLPSLPQRFLNRKIRLTTLGDALTLPQGSFIKSAISKHISGKLWSPADLQKATERLHPELLVLVAEPVQFLLEFRCFVAGREIATVSPYRRFDQVFDETRPSINQTSDETDAARGFAETVIRSANVECPPAFVVDVGYIKGQGWAVVEANECWASGIYYCDPINVLGVLRQACIPANPRTDTHVKWDFGVHYSAAVIQ
jgi:hypothetical protein